MPLEIESYDKIEQARLNVTALAIKTEKKCRKQRRRRSAIYAKPFGDIPSIQEIITLVREREEREINDKQEETLLL